MSTQQHAPPLLATKSVARLIVLILLAGCSGSGEGLDENGRPLLSSSSGIDSVQPIFSDIQRSVLTPTCAVSGCHSGSSAPLGLALEANVAFDNLVNRVSVQQADILLVAPGDPDNSYMIQKLEGSAASGSRMPRNQPPLPPALIAVVREWIANGATMETAKRPVR